MKNSDPKHTAENELDFLLRQLALEDPNDPFTQNLLMMNAEIVFAHTPQVTPAPAREREMLQRLEKAFFPAGRGRWLWSALLLLLIGGGMLVYWLRTPEIVPPVSSAENHSSSAAPVLPHGNSGTVDAAAGPSLPETSGRDPVAPTDTLATEKDSANRQPATTEKSWTHTETHMPEEQPWYEGEYAVNVPGPTFSAKPSPENFRPVKGTFSPDTNRFSGVMFRPEQASFTATYYKGAPFRNGMDDLQYFNFGEYVQKVQAGAEELPSHWQMPWAVLEYADTGDVTIETRKNARGISSAGLVLKQFSPEGIRRTMQPFYFRKFEVTNKEYREFLDWVRASNGYASKPICVFETDTLPDDGKHPANEHLTVKGKKYYLVHKRIVTEDFREVFNYTFFNANNEAAKALGKKALYVMPDTLAWVNDFTFSANEPMTNMYFWHPAYDDYPVVGVSWFQAMAFLDWKTHMHQEQLDAAGVPYEIEYTLPSDIEWELVSIASPWVKNLPSFLPHNECTEDWLTNLGVSYPGYDDPYQRPNYLKNLLLKDQYYRGDYIADGFFHTGPANLATTSNIYYLETKNRHLDPLRISWMDGNVSEWMLGSYSENWQPFFGKHLLALGADTSESTRLAKQIEMLYDKGNAHNGRLVRGANWYDERFGGRPGSERNETGLSAKRYLDPSEQHCTVGFRYVVHVKYKDEQLRISMR